MKKHKLNFEKIIYAITIGAFSLLIVVACVYLSAWLIEVTFFE